MASAILAGALWVVIGLVIIATDPGGPDDGASQ